MVTETKTEEVTPAASEPVAEPVASVQEPAPPQQEGEEQTPTVDIEALTKAVKALGPDKALALFTKEERLAAEGYRADVKAQIQGIEDRAEARARYEREAQERQAQRQSQIAQIEEQLQSSDGNPLSEARKLAGLRETLSHDATMDALAGAVAANRFYPHIPEEKVKDLNARASGDVGRWANATLDAVAEAAYAAGEAAGKAAAAGDLDSRRTLTEEYVRQKLTADLHQLAGTTPPNLPPATGPGGLTWEGFNALPLEEQAKVPTEQRRAIYEEHARRTSGR